MLIFSTPAAGRGWPLNSCPTISGQPSIGTSVNWIGLRRIWALLDQDIAQDAIEDHRLMTITGVNLAVAAGIMAAIGDISQFNTRRS